MSAVDFDYVTLETNSFSTYHFLAAQYRTKMKSVWPTTRSTKPTFAFEYMVNGLISWRYQQCIYNRHDFQKLMKFNQNCNTSTKSSFCVLGPIWRASLFGTVTFILNGHRPLTNTLLDTAYELKSHIYIEHDEKKSFLYSGGLKSANPSKP
jgi:hypothetical protein